MENAFCMSAADMQRKCKERTASSCKASKCYKRTESFHLLKRVLFDSEIGDDWGTRKAGHRNISIRLKKQSSGLSAWSSREGGSELVWSDQENLFVDFLNNDWLTLMQLISPMHSFFKGFWFSKIIKSTFPWVWDFLCAFVPPRNWFWKMLWKPWKSFSCGHVQGTVKILILSIILRRLMHTAWKRFQTCLWVSKLIWRVYCLLEYTISNQRQSSADNVDQMGAK